MKEEREQPQPQEQLVEEICKLNERLGHLLQHRREVSLQLEKMDKEINLLYKRKYHLERQTITIKKCKPGESGRPLPTMSPKTPPPISSLSKDEARKLLDKLSMI